VIRTTLLATLAISASVAYADITITGRSGGPPLVEGTHYYIGQYGDGSYFVDIQAYYDTVQQNQYYVAIGDGDVIQLLQVTVPYSGGSKEVLLYINSATGATSGRLDAVTTPTQELVRLNVDIRGSIGALDANEIGVSLQPSATAAGSGGSVPVSA